MKTRLLKLSLSLVLLNAAATAQPQSILTDIPSAVPEPSTLILAGLGGLGLLLFVFCRCK